MIVPDTLVRSEETAQSDSELITEIKEEPADYDDEPMTEEYYDDDDDDDDDDCGDIVNYDDENDSSSDYEDLIKSSNEDSRKIKSKDDILLSKDSRKMSSKDEDVSIEKKIYFIALCNKNINQLLFFSAS